MHGECMGTFLGPYRLEKRSKSHGVSENSITIEIPIQMSICRSLLLELHLRSLVKSAGKLTSCKSYWVSEAQLRIYVCVVIIYQLSRDFQAN